MFWSGKAPPPPRDTHTDMFYTIQLRTYTDMCYTIQLRTYPGRVGITYNIRLAGIAHSIGSVFKNLSHKSSLKNIPKKMSKFYIFSLNNSLFFTHCLKMGWYLRKSDPNWVIFQRFSWLHVLIRFRTSSNRLLFICFGLVKPFLPQETHTDMCYTIQLRTYPGNVGIT